MTASPFGQTTGAPAAHETMSQPSVPASAAGQWTTQLAPAAQLVWQGEAVQVNVHLLSSPQVHWPSAQVPLQVVCGSQVTWQGGAWQAKLQWLPLPHVQVPLAQTAWQLGLSPSQVA